MSRPTIQLGEAAVPARSQGETALSGAWNQRKSEPPKCADMGAGGATRNAASPALGTETLGLRFPLTSSSGEGRFATWASWGCGLVKQDFGARLDFSQGVDWGRSNSDVWTQQRTKPGAC